MLLNLATLSLAITLASVPDSIRGIPPGSVLPDSGRVAHRDSTPPLARSMARVGIGAEAGNGTAGGEAAGTVADTTQRRHAVEYSDWYYRRLTIHKVASYATIPHPGCRATVIGAMVGLGMSAERAVALALSFVTGVRSPNGKDLTFPIPAADGATIDRDNDMILARYQGKAYAFGLACPHQNTALRWLAEEGRFQCPKHKSKYAPDGTFLSGRATRSMDRYAVRKDGSNIVVSLDTLYEQDKQKPQWESAFVTA